MSASLIKEPLLHFAIAGAILFAAYSGLNHNQPAPTNASPIRIDDGKVRWLQETFTNQWQRPPSETELHGLVDGLVEEELLAREAVALGLDRDDTIVRRRLAQKMAFLIGDTTRVAGPSDAALQAYFLKEADRFREPARVSFTQVFFSATHRPNAAIDASTALAAIRVSANRDPIGDPSVLEADYTNLDQQAVANLFGASFASAVFKLAPGSWAGPINSAYGQHLVRVTSFEPAASPHFEAVRTKVLNEWRHDQETAAKTVYIASLRQKYGVIIDSDIGPLLGRDLEPVR